MPTRTRRGLPSREETEIQRNVVNKNTSIAHFTLATQDVARAAQFYESTLGWRSIDRPQNLERAAAWLAIGANQEVHFLEVDGFEVSLFEAEFGRHIAVSYNVEEFAALKDRLVAAGAELVAPERETPFDRFFFRDLDGYIIEVIDAEHEPEQ